MFRSFCQPLAPSSDAALYNSAGVDCNAPVATTLMNGQPNQTLANSRA